MSRIQIIPNWIFFSKIGNLPEGVLETELLQLSEWYLEENFKYADEIDNTSEADKELIDEIRNGVF